MKKILLCVTASIAIIKIPELIKLFKESNNYEIKLIITNCVEKFITKLTFETLLQDKVYSDDDIFMDKTLHIDIAREIDCILVAPASANTIAKIANGICDNLLTIALMARKASTKCFFAPAMNTEMWFNPANQRNIETLEKDGVTIISPIEGYQVCKEFGIGNMEEPKKIFEVVDSNLKT
jgi:phosphopantothenoylcysteine decarboxylase/phosphopantothenate--cysteine ligase